VVPFVGNLSEPWYQPCTNIYLEEELIWALSEINKLKKKNLKQKEKLHKYEEEDRDVK
jgi:hypothetical protein